MSVATCRTHYQTLRLRVHRLDGEDYAVDVMIPALCRPGETVQPVAVGLSDPLPLPEDYTVDDMGPEHRGHHGTH